MNICPTVSYTEKVYSACVKPITKTATGRWRLLTAPIVDKYCFSYSDKSLMPGFLNSLLAINSYNDNTKASRIKDKILKAMGYKHPELLKTKPAFVDNFSFSFERGILLLPPGRELYTDTANLVGIIRHELEHVDQAVKLYKAIGETAFIDMLRQINKKDTDISNIINLNFYRQMAKDVDISDFNAEIFYKANLDYNNATGSFEGMHKYIENPLEKEAFKIQKRVMQLYGKNIAVVSDTFPKNYKTFIQLMNIINIPENAQMEMYNSLLHMNVMKEYLNTETIEKMAPVMSKIENKEKLTRKDIEIYYDIMPLIENVLNTLNEKQIHDLIMKVEESLRQKKYTVNDIFGAV